MNGKVSFLNNHDFDLFIGNDWSCEPVDSWALRFNYLQWIIEIPAQPDEATQQWSSCLLHFASTESIAHQNGPEFVHQKRRLFGVSEKGVCVSRFSSVPNWTIGFWAISDKCNCMISNLLWSEIDWKPIVCIASLIELIRNRLTILSENHLPMQPKATDKQPFRKNFGDLITVLVFSIGHKVSFCSGIEHSAKWGKNHLSNEYFITGRKIENCDNL